jgi:hypothetical protein
MIIRYDLLKRYFDDRRDKDPVLLLDAIPKNLEAFNKTKNLLKETN